MATTEVEAQAAEHGITDVDVPDRPARQTGRGPLRGLRGLVAAELRRWFPVRAFTLAVLGSAAVVTVYVMWSSGANAANPRLGSYIYGALGVWTMLLLLATVATTQGAMADEIEAGTAAWVIAKPVGRPAFVLSKFLAAIPGVLLGAIVVPGFVLRMLIVAAEGQGDTDFSASDVFGLIQEGGSEEFMTLPPIERHLSALTLLLVVLLFIVAVMILLGCAVRSRAGVFLLGLAVPIGLLVYSIAGPSTIVELTPAWAFDALLTTIRNEAAPVLAPSVVTGAWTVGTVALATAWFSRMEL